MAVVTLDDVHNPIGISTGEIGRVDLAAHSSLTAGVSSLHLKTECYV